jgi:MFS transporter
MSVTLKEELPMSNCTALPAVDAAPARTLSPRVSFFLLASITVSFLAGSLAPTPLYPVYQAEWGFSALTTTEIFGIYALALLGSLLFVGRLSDHLGRRPVLIVATLVQAVVMFIFATANGVGALMLARVVQGIATGAALGAVGAGMLDLNKARGPVANAVTPPLGTGAGGLLAGLLVHYLPAPTLLVYVVLAIVFVVQALGVSFMAETVMRRAGAVASLKPQFGLPAASQAPMIIAAPVLIAAWSLAGFYASLIPALTRSVFGFDPSLASGIAAFVLAGSAAATVLALSSRAPRTVMAYGAIALIAGTAAAMGALGAQSAAGFFAASALAGSGLGAGFQGAMRTVLPTAKAHERAGVLSVVFVVSYLAMAVPAIAAGFFVSHGGALLPTAQHFGFVVEALAAFALLGTLLEGKVRATWNAMAPRHGASPRG